MMIKPIIPIWVMAIICIFWLVLKRKSIWGYIRQIAIILLVFMINLRVMVPDENVKIKTRNLDLYVIFVIDSTISMVAEDYNGNETRLSAVQNDCKKIVDELYGSKFCTISFNNKAKLMSPFTSDANLTRNLIDSIGPIDHYYARGTSLNICRELTLEVLKKAKEKGDGKIVVFFVSDGEMNGTDELGSFEEMSQYIDYGAVMGYGTEKGGNMYYINYEDKETAITFWNDDFEEEKGVSKIDENTLKQIASDLNVPYKHMEKAEDVDELVKDALKAANSDSDSEDTQGTKDISFVFVIPLTLLLVYELFTNKKENIQF